MVRNVRQIYVKGSPLKTIYVKGSLLKVITEGVLEVGGEVPACSPRISKRGRRGGSRHRDARLP